MVGIRKHRTLTRGTKAHRTQPGYLPQAEECLQEICSFLAAKFPSCFTVSRVKFDRYDAASEGDSISGKEAGAVSSIANLITGDFFDFTKLRLEEGEAWNPMRYAGLLLQDDLAVMVEDVNGEYRFQAGSICLAG